MKMVRRKYLEIENDPVACRKNFVHNVLSLSRNSLLMRSMLLMKVPKKRKPLGL